MEAFIHPALANLFNGIKSFQRRTYTLNAEKMKSLLDDGQQSKVLVISCSDSRVDPALLMDASAGDLIVLRQIANLVPPYTLAGKHDGGRATIEYAVRDLQVEHIIVLGHAHCSGIKTLLGTFTGQKPPRDFLTGWVSIAMDGCYRYVIGQLADTGDDGSGCSVRELDLDGLCEHQHLVERAAIRGSLDNLKTYPWIQDRLASGNLTLHGWWFDLETGDLWATSADHAAFLPVLD